MPRNDRYIKQAAVLFTGLPDGLWRLDFERFGTIDGPVERMGKGGGALRRRQPIDRATGNIAKNRPNRVDRVAVCRFQNEDIPSCRGGRGTDCHGSRASFGRLLRSEMDERE